jgi:hypothetical protein
VRRPVLLSVMAAGAVISLVSTTGIFAVFTDRATTGTNSLQTGALAKAVDVQVATFTPSSPGNSLSGTCGAFTDDSTTPLLNVETAQPSATTFRGPTVCVKNAGSLAASVRQNRIDVADVEVQCTGDEATVDTTCGGSGAGEVARSLEVMTWWGDCAGASGNSGPFVLFGNEVAARLFQPGQVMCVYQEFRYNPTGDNAIAGQSDRLTWRYAYDAESS